MTCLLTWLAATPATLRQYGYHNKIQLTLVTRGRCVLANGVAYRNCVKGKRAAEHALTCRRFTETFVLNYNINTLASRTFTLGRGGCVWREVQITQAFSLQRLPAEGQPLRQGNTRNESQLYKVLNKWKDTFLGRNLGAVVEEYPTPIKPVKKKKMH